MPSYEQFLLDQIAQKSRTTEHTILALPDIIKLLEQIHELATRRQEHERVLPQP